MRPLTLHTPKNLIEIAGRPFLDYQLELLSKNNVERVVLSTGYLGHKIEDYVESHSTHGIKVEVCHEKELLGTGGAIINSLPALPDDFFLIYGDSYLTQPFAPVQAAFAASGNEALMTVLGQDSGTTENNCAISGGKVARYQKGQPAGTFKYMDYGLLFFRKEALRKYPLGNFSTDRIFLDLISRGQLAAFVTSSPYFEVGSKEGLKKFEHEILEVAKKAGAPKSRRK